MAATGAPRLRLSFRSELQFVVHPAPTEDAEVVNHQYSGEVTG